MYMYMYYVLLFFISRIFGLLKNRTSNVASSSDMNFQKPRVKEKCLLSQRRVEKPSQCCNHHFGNVP